MPTSTPIYGRLQLCRSRWIPTIPTMFCPKRSTSFRADSIRRLLSRRSARPGRIQFAESEQAGETVSRFSRKVNDCLCNMCETLSAPTASVFEERNKKTRSLQLLVFRFAIIRQWIFKRLRAEIERCKYDWICRVICKNRKRYSTCWNICSVE